MLLMTSATVRWRLSMIGEFEIAMVDLFDDNDGDGGAMRCDAVLEQCDVLVVVMCAEQSFVSSPS
jgi:hypothetical protein